MEKRRSSGIATQLKRNFTVTSVDNIDFLQSHAAVYSGDQHYTWHGASIQAVQPKSTLPELSIQPAIATSCLAFTCNSEPSIRTTANYPPPIFTNQHPPSFTNQHSVSPTKPPTNLPVSSPPQPLAMISNMLTITTFTECCNTSAKGSNSKK